MCEWARILDPVYIHANVYSHSGSAPEIVNIVYNHVLLLPCIDFVNFSFPSQKGTCFKFLTVWKQTKSTPFLSHHYLLYFCCCPFNSLKKCTRTQGEAFTVCRCIYRPCMGCLNVISLTQKQAPHCMRRTSWCFHCSTGGPLPPKRPTVLLACWPASLWKAFPVRSCPAGLWGHSKGKLLGNGGFQN